MSSWLHRFWYRDNHPLKYLLYPLHFILALLVTLRKTFYQLRSDPDGKSTIPVIIVGNISVGGTGKSPLVIHLARGLSQAGFNVGILSRGYGGSSAIYPLEVTLDSSPLQVGDEPLMIKMQTPARVVVDPKRKRGAALLKKRYACNVIICDDGLQHYALQRHIEIAVVDAARQFGNGLLIPFGPLREPVSRLTTVDALVFNGSNSQQSKMHDNQFVMTLGNSYFVALSDTNKKVAIADFLQLCEQQHKPIHCVAGIGNPQRFFEQIDKLGLKTINHPFADHHQYQVDDFKKMDGTIIMTEKDAIKCHTFSIDNSWYLKVTAEVSPSIVEHCLTLIEHKSEKI